MDYNKPIKKDQYWTLYTHSYEKLFSYYGNEKNAKAYAIRKAQGTSILLMCGYRELRKEPFQKGWSVFVFEE